MLSSVLTLVLLVSSCAAVDYDIAILNFALNLEYLEGNFYSCAAFGYPLNGSLIGGGPVATGCNGKALLSPETMALAEEIAKDEIAHVKFLRTALGAAAVPQPINICTAFVSLFNAAFKTTFPTAYSPYDSDVLFLMGAFIFEDVGVTAYKGAAPLITNKDYLGPAAGILAVEGYHAGSVRRSLLQTVRQYVFPYAVTVSSMTSAIANLRSSVDGIGRNDFGVYGASTAVYRVVSVDKNALAFGRLPKAVLPIVYLGGKSKGGFFPNGMNGMFNSSTTSP